MPTEREIGARIELAARAAFGPHVKAPAIAEALGVPYQSYMNHTRKGVGSSKHAAFYAARLGVDLDWLLENRGEPPALNDVAASYKIAHSEFGIMEAERVDVDAITDRDLQATIRRELAARPKSECWRLRSRLLAAGGYNLGDYLIVDPRAELRSPAIVLALRHSARQDEKPVALVRVYLDPYLAVLGPLPPGVQVEVVGEHVSVFGVVVRHLR